jgi:hypothetical protein
MKKLTFLAVALVAVAMLFTSCKKDENNSASVSLSAGAGLVTGNTTVTAGAAFKIKWSATSSSTDMKFVSITRDDVAIANWNDKPIDSDFSNTYIDSATLTAPPSGGPFVYAVVVMDKDKNELARTEFTITLAAPLTEVTFTAHGDVANPGNVVGAGSSDYGSYVDLDGGVIYKFTDATGSFQSVIDVIFDQSSLSNNDGTSGHFTGTGTNLKVVTLTYAEATSSAALAGISVTSSDKTAAVSTGTVVYFETASHKGLMHIISLTTVAGNKNTITIEAKMMPK